jgi:hypothetical protein
MFAVELLSHLLPVVDMLWWAELGFSRWRLILFSLGRWCVGVVYRLTIHLYVSSK